MPPTGLRDSLQRFSDMASPGPTHQAWGRGVRVVVCSSKDSTAGTRGSALRQEPGGTAALQPRERGQPRRGQFSLRWLRAGPASPGSARPPGGQGRGPWRKGPATQAALILPSAPRRPLTRRGHQQTLQWPLGRPSAASSTRRPRTSQHPPDPLGLTGQWSEPSWACSPAWNACTR